MRGSRLCGLALLALGFAPSAYGQTYEQLQKELHELRSRNAALEAANVELRTQFMTVQQDDRPKGTDAVIVSFDPATNRLVVRIGDRERVIDLKPEIHVHDEKDFEVRPANRADKLKPGVRISIVEEAGQVIEINLGAGHKHDHKHDHDDHAHDGEWRHVDPFYKGWWKPTDDYQVNSWKPPASEGFFKDLLCGQFVDTHRSSCGTPWVHPFTIEPAHLHRDLYFIYKYARDADGEAVDEHELEVHFDWALTRRFGVLLGIPYLGLINPDELDEDGNLLPGEQATGFGDLEVAPRIVFIESETFFLSANILVTIPIGDQDRDLGAGETIIAPFLTSWNDLGTLGPIPWRNWNTLFMNVGPEYGVDSGDGVMTYSVVFVHSLLGPRIVFQHHHNGHANGHNGNGHGHAHNGNGHAHNGGGTISVFGPHYPPGLLNLHLEFNGQTELQDERFTFLQLLTGFSYEVTENLEFRFGVNFPLNRPQQQFDARYEFAFGYFF